MTVSCRPKPPRSDLEALLEHLPADVFWDNLRRLFGYLPREHYFDEGRTRAWLLPVTRDFHPARAFFLAEASALVYDSPARIHRELKERGFEVQVFGRPEADLLLARGGREAILIFPGTDLSRPRSFLHNLDPFLIPFCGYRVHRGYLRRYCALSRKYNLPALISGLPKGTRLYLAGHSQGGSCAVLAALHLSRKGAISPERVSVFTFGSPGTIAGHVDFVLFRVVADGDPIPRLSPVPEYHRAGQLIRVGCQHDLPPGRFPVPVRPVAGFRALREGRGALSATAELLGPLIDHSLTVYAARLRALSEKPA